MTPTCPPPAAIEALFDEHRTFPPPPEFASRATVRDAAIYAEAAADPDAWWSAQAERLAWRRPWTEVLDWSDAPFARWFVGGRLNVTESCLDRHLTTQPDKVAFHWEGEPGDTRSLTYRELHGEVCRAANGLRALGVDFRQVSED